MSTQARSLPPVRRRALALSGAVLLTASLAAFGGGNTSSGSSSADNGSSGGSKAAAPQPGHGFAEASPAATPGDGSTGSGTSTAARILPSDRDVVYTGSISVRVKDIGRATARAESLAAGAGGVVFSEQTSTDPRHPQYGEATLTLRVPPSAFGPTLDALGGLGKELDRQRSAEDVTTQVVDVESRVRSQQRSVDRVRVLLSRAKTIGEVVQVESELSRREADLESLQAQQAKLKDVTDLATLEVSFTSPDRTPAPTTNDGRDLGFLSGLNGGWDAFVAITLVALTVLGALVPFAVTVALVGVPLLLLWRSRRRTQPAPSTPAEL
jgi:hypothetical protein